MLPFYKPLQDTVKCFQTILCSGHVQESHNVVTLMEVSRSRSGHWYVRCLQLPGAKIANECNNVIQNNYCFQIISENTEMEELVYFP